MLKSINLKAPSGSFIAVVGAVGSGKSSLLSAILGEIEKIEGKVNVNRGTKIAFVPQLAWIQNATVKDNIIFGQEFDKRKYEKTIKSCALRQDLAMLSGGDETEIGEKGINLSGGQKQRISLARACYSDADLYLFDDPLSAVDSHVGKHILDEVLSSKSGILKDKTRILVTNSMFALPHVDFIIVLKDGCLTESGTYEELLNRPGDFAELLEQYTTQKETEHIQIGSPLKRSNTIEKKEEAVKKTKLIEEERSDTGAVNSTVYLNYFAAMTFLWTFGIFLFNILLQCANIGANFWLSG